MVLCEMLNKRRILSNFCGNWIYRTSIQLAIGSNYWRDGFSCNYQPLGNGLASMIGGLDVSSAYTTYGENALFVNNNDVVIIEVIVWIN